MHHCTARGLQLRYMLSCSLPLLMLSIPCSSFENGAHRFYIECFDPGRVFNRWAGLGHSPLVDAQVQANGPGPCASGRCARRRRDNFLRAALARARAWPATHSTAAQEIETKPGIPPIGLVRFVPDSHCNVSAQVLCCTLSPRGVLAPAAWHRVERA